MQKHRARAAVDGIQTGGGLPDPAGGGGGEGGHEVRKSMQAVQQERNRLDALLLHPD